MEKYKASVIIPTYNRLDELKLTLDSLVSQQSSYEFEVIVADDGSYEDTKSLIDRYIGNLNIKYCFQEDKGFRAGSARNMGIKLSKGDICIFIDNGIILHSQAIESHINTHINEQVPCIVLGYVYGFETEKGREEELISIITQNSPDDAIDMLRRAEMYDIRESCYQVLGSDLWKWPAPFVVCFSCNLSVTRDMLIKVDMFDEFFTGWGSEDLDLGLSLFKSGVKFILSRGASSIHYPHKKYHSFDVPVSLENMNRTQLYEVMNHRKKERHMLKKHPIRPMELWINITDPVELNRALLEEGK